MQEGSSPGHVYILMLTKKMQRIMKWICYYTTTLLLYMCFLLQCVNKKRFFFSEIIQLPNWAFLINSNNVNFLVRAPGV